MQCSGPNVTVVQCSSQMSVLSTGVCILETLSFELRRTPIFTKSRRETHLTLWCGLDWVQHTFGPFFFYGSVTGQAGHATAQAVSCWLPTAATRVRSRVWSSGICGGQSGAGAGFLRVLRFPLPIFILPKILQLHNHPGQAQ
jgi:hypothetical protein